MSRSREYLAFSAATAVVVLHVLVDSFVSLEPGATRRDHVLAAIVAVGIAVAAILLYPRMRAGLQGVTALVFGVLALVGGGLAAAALGGGVTAAAVTGLLVVAAGLALCVLGATVLWRSRNPGGNRYLRRILIGLAAVLLAFWVLVPVALALVATQRPRVAVEPADLGRPYEEVTITTSDGLDLAGWYVPSENGAAVIVFPGRIGTLDHGRMLAGNGYGVLLLDMRGQSESDGDQNLFGWGATRDLDAAVAFLEGRPDVEAGRIGGIGLSVGGEQLLEAAAGNPALAAVVSDGAGVRSVREALLRGPAGWFTLPQEAVLTLATAVLSGNAPPPALDDLVGRISPSPVMFVYAGNGQGGEDLNPEYFDAAGEPKTLWEIPEADHTGGIDARPGEYEQRVVEFFDAALLTTP